MVEGIRQIEVILRTNEKTLTDFKIEFRDSVVMYPYSNKELKKG